MVCFARRIVLNCFARSDLLFHVDVYMDTDSDSDPRKYAEFIANFMAKATKKTIRIR